MNSEAVMSGDYVVPQIYQKKNSITTKYDALDMVNAYYEGEGAAVGFVPPSHINENVIIVSNDTDSLFHCLIAANKRDRICNKFTTEFWLEIIYTTRNTGK